MVISISEREVTDHLALSVMYKKEEYKRLQCRQLELIKVFGQQWSIRVRL